MTPLVETLRKPWWWCEDVEFDPTGETQLEWARDGAAAYRASHPERYGVTKSVTGSVTPLKSVTPSVTGITESVTSVTSKKEKTAERTRRWREKKRKASDELS